MYFFINYNNYYIYFKKIIMINLYEQNEISGRTVSSLSLNCWFSNIYNQFNINEYMDNMWGKTSHLI